MKVHTFPYGALGGNCYLCINDKGTDAVIVDPVAPPDYVLKNHPKGLKIHYILITHCHFDHLLSYNIWRDYANIPTAILAEDAHGLVTPSVNLNGVFYGQPLSYPKADILLKDGQVLSFGESTVKVIATPGHTAGSCCFLTESVLFTGDTLFAGGGYGRTDFPTGDDAALFASIRKLCALPEDTVIYPGHGDKDTIKNIKSILG